MTDPESFLECSLETLGRFGRLRFLFGKHSGAMAIEAVLNRHLWMMKAWNANGRWDRVLYHKSRQEELMRALLRSTTPASAAKDIAEAEEIAETAEDVLEPRKR